MGEEKKSMAEKDYGHRDVVDKLAIRPGYAIVFAAAAEDEAVDVVLASVDDTTDAIEVLQRWRTRLKPSSGIWLLTTKRGQPGYVDQRELIAAGLQAGVVDNKVCSVSPMMGAMRFVI